MCLGSCADNQVTIDSLCRGKLRLYQPQKGYRFSLDALLLAGLTTTSKDDQVVDFGTGCGVIPLLLAFTKRVAHVTGVEIQAELARLAERNVHLNNLGDVVSIIHADLRQLRPSHIPDRVTLVVSNPPYRELDSGRINPVASKAIARHELLADLSAVVSAAHRILPHRGRLALIYPVRRLCHLLRVVAEGGFGPARLILIHTTMESPAKLVHLEAIKGGNPEMRVERPFAIYRKDGEYTEEMEVILACGSVGV